MTMFKAALNMFTCFSLCLSLSMAPWNMTTAAAQAAPPPVSVVDWNEERQVVDGFGGSGAFKKAKTVMNLPEPERTRILDMIFSQEKGIGLSIVRNLVGDGVAADSVEPQPGVYVWDDPQWETKKASFDADQIWLMNEAKKRGVTTFFSSVWSPPAWMKTNNSVAGTGNAKLKPEHYQDFADYLAAYVQGYKKHFDLDISYISIANEPNYAASYSGCVWTPEEMNVFIRDYLGPTFKAGSIEAKIVMPEHVNFTEAYALPALNDPVTANYIDVVASHAYGIGAEVPAFPVSAEKGKQIWQTEYMNIGAAKQTYRNNTIPDALRYANLIGNMFDITRLGAYFWWWPAASNGADGSDLIRLVTDEANQENGLFRVFKRYYSFGNYSRFIRPGYIMIGADKHPVDQVMITAYKHPENGNFAIVAVNNSPDNQQITFNLNGFPLLTQELVPYRTSSNENLEKLKSIKGKDSSFTVELKGASVTTFIPKSFELPAFEEMKDVFSTYEAEENDGQAGGLAVQRDGTGRKYLADAKNGHYLKYTNVNFADGTANGIAEKLHILGMNAHVFPLHGGTIEVRLDDPVKGKLVGTFTVPGQSDAREWITLPAMLDTNPQDGAYGFHDMYLVFKGAYDKKLFHVDAFTFGDGTQENVEVKTHIYDFEENSTEGWSGRSGSNVVEVTQEQFQSGQYSLKTTNRTSSWHGPITNVTDKIKLGVAYEFSAYVRLAEVPASPSSIKLTMQVDGDQGVSYVGIGSASVSTTDWVQVKGTYTAPADAAVLSLYVESSNPTESFYIDNVVLAPAASPSP
ncbi:glucuronoarabinoxylan endo-1,4-beta-xylanase [Paenibacillus mucilaginosus]